MDDFFSLDNTFSYHCFHGKKFYVLHSLIPLFQTFTVQTYHATYTETNQRHSLCNPLVRKKSRSNSFFLQPLHRREESLEGSSPIATSLTSSSQCSTVVFPLYPHDPHLPPSFYVHTAISASKTLL